ncbi:hypothetical protein PMAYCL1PPCAC_26077, partial [Pristionchus mayeri]
EIRVIARLLQQPADFRLFSLHPGRCVRDPWDGQTPGEAFDCQSKIEKNLICGTKPANTASPSDLGL